jgi:hypothetical protein
VEKDLMKFYFHMQKDLSDPLQACLIKARDIKARLERDLQDKISKLIEFLTSDLFYISKEEGRMNKKNYDEIRKLQILIFPIGDLNKVAVKKNEYLKELRTLSESMKTKITKFDQLTEK